MGFQTAGEVILSFGNSNKTISKLPFANSDKIIFWSSNIINMKLPFTNSNKTIYKLPFANSDKILKTS